MFPHQLLINCQEEKKLVTVQWKTGATYVPGDQN